MTAPDRAARPAAERAAAHTCLEFESYRYHDLLPRLRAALQGDFDGSAVVGALQAALRDLDDELSGRTPVGTGRREYAAIDAQQLLAFLEGASRPAAEGEDATENHGAIRRFAEAIGRGSTADLTWGDMGRVLMLAREGLAARSEGEHRPCDLPQCDHRCAVCGHLWPCEDAARPAPAAATPPPPEGAGDAWEGDDEPNLCTVCGEGGFRYGERHSVCGRAVMEAERRGAETALRVGARWMTELWGA